MSTRQVTDLEDAKPPERDSGFAERGKGLRMWDHLWADWRLGMAVAVAAVVTFAQICGEVIPRGPVTSAQALVSMTAALGVGLAVGFATGNRWTMLLAPAVFTVVFELKRLELVGPTVDMVNLGSFYGVTAFVLGRLFPAVLLLATMIMGARLGVGLAAHLGHGSARTMGPGTWTGVSMVALVFVVLAFFIARPASTAPIVGPDGESLEGSVSELATTPIGGHDLTMLIRGRSTDSPVLLYLTGGPGGTDLGAIRRDVTLEQDFVVVVWDQRGAGKSYGSLDPTDTFILDQMVSDTIEVTDYLRDRFDQDKIFLVGQSWGSTLGVLAAQQAPERFQALVGVGQMVSQRETDILFWEDTLAWAEETANTGLAATLRENGPPPYDNLILYDPVVSHEHDWNRYPEMDLSNEMPGILFVPEYTFMDRINAFRGFLDTNATLYPQLQDLDFRRDVPGLEVPYYMVLGEYEARGRSLLAEEWFAMVDAPIKERIIIDGGGHRAHFDQPARFAAVMNQVREHAQSIEGLAP